MIDFNQMTDAFLSREMRPREVGKYYPSEIGHCMRKIWFSYKIPKETDKDLVKIFEAGNMIHNFVVNVLKSEKNSHIKLEESELPFKFAIDDFMVSGRIDNLISIKENGKKVLMEVKSCRNIGSVNEPKPENVLQLQFYLHVLKMEHGMLLYVDKADLQSRSFTMNYNPEIAEEAVQRFRILNAHLITGKIPFPEAKLDPKLQMCCSNCEYKEECMRTDNSL